MDERIPTAVAAARWDDNVFRGFSVRDDLAGRIDAWSAISLAVGHRRLTQEEAAVLDDIVVCALAADPRIWPLKIVRLLSSYGHATAGTVAGIYCTEAARIGWRAYFIAAEFLEELATCTDAAAREAELTARLQRKENLPGYGVAHRRRDERAAALRECLKHKGRTTGLYWRLAGEIETLLAPKGIFINMGAAGAAAMLDLGFSPKQLLALGPYLVYANYLANAVEGADQASEVHRRLPSHTIKDESPSLRRSPRALASAKPRQT